MIFSDHRLDFVEYGGDFHANQALEEHKRNAWAFTLGHEEDLALARLDHHMRCGSIVEPIILRLNDDSFVQEGKFVRLHICLVGAPLTILCAEELGGGALVCKLSRVLP